MWWNLPYGETIQSTTVYQGRFIIVSTSMIWYIDDSGKVTPFEVVCPTPPPSPVPLHAA